jgi:uncharacterized membrane protein (UPF0127 family)
MTEGTKFRIRFVADNDEKRTKGLMHAEPLEDDEVVLFIFPHPDRYGFWNKNVSFGLSLAFCDANGKIVHFSDMKPNDPTKVGPENDNVMFVVEAKEGAFSKIGAKKGDLINYSNNLLTVHKTSSRHAQNNEKNNFQKNGIKKTGIDINKLEVNLLAGSLKEDYK